MKFLRQVLSPVKRASGEEIVGEELEKKEEDETERIETRNLNGLCPLFAAATTITREGSRGNFGRGGNSHPLRIGHWWTWGWKREAIQGGLIKAELEKCRGTFLYRLYRTFEIVDALGRGF